MSKHGETVENALKVGEDVPNEGNLDEESEALLALFEEKDPKAEVEAEEQKAQEEAQAEADASDDVPEPEEAGKEPTPPPLGEVQGLVPEEKAEEADPKEVAKQREEWRAQALEKLESYFSEMLSQEDKDLLLTEPDKVFARIMGHSYLDMYDTMMTNLTQQMPGRVAELIEMQQKAQTYEQQFYERWPQLREAASDQEKLGVIQRTVEAYRKVNPDAPVEQAIEEAGAMAMVSLRIPVEEKKAEAPQEKEAFTPASPGASATPPPKETKPTNPFEILAQEFLEDDE